MIAEKKYSFKDFEEHCRRIAESTSMVPTETTREKEKRKAKLLSNYGLFFEYYLKFYCEGKDGTVTKCAWYQIYVAHMLLKFPIIFLILEWFRGSAKSIHADLGFPLWLWAHDELKCMVLLGQNETIACILLSDIQAQFEFNALLINDYGPQATIGTWEEGEFKTRNGAAFFARGMGQSTRGLRNGPHRPDYIVGDDLDTEELSRNPKRIKDAVNWLNDGVLGTVDIGNQRFLLVNNGPFANSIMRSMVKEKLTGAFKMPIRQVMRSCRAAGAFLYQIKGKWHHLRVNAVDDEWQPTWPEKYTREYWKDFAADRSMRSWLREWQNTPIVEGGVFKPDWIQWKRMQPLKEYDRIINYVDPSAKDHGDFKAVKMWGSYKTELHHIRAFLRQCSRADLVNRLYDDYEFVRDKGAILTTQIEGNFAQDELLKDEIYSEGIRRRYQLPYTFDKRKKGDKFQRIESCSPHYEHRNVYWNEAERQSSDMIASEAQLLAIEQGSKAPDDGPDADEGAIYFLMQKRRAGAFEPRGGSYKRQEDM